MAKKGTIYLNTIKRNYESMKNDFIDSNWSGEEKFLVTQYYYNICNANIDLLKEKCYSKISGKILTFNKGFRYDKEEANKMRGSFYRGKKRPEHSKKLKNKPNEKNKKANWSHARLEYHRLMNTLEWKKKVLTNKGLNISNLDNKTIISIFNQYQSNRVKNINTNISKLKNFLTKPQYLYFLTNEYIQKIENDIDSFNIEEIKLHIKSMNAIISTVANSNINNNMGNPIFIKTLLRTNNFSNYIGQKDVIKTRSNLEKDLITFLENNNIKWDYEPITYKIKEQRYTPDFLIYLDGVKYIVEIKQYYRSLNQMQQQEIKMNFISQNYNFIFLDSIPKTIQQLKTTLDMQIFIKTHPKSNNIFKNNLGLTREQIIDNLEKGEVFIHHLWYLYTCDANFKIIKSHLVIGNKCKSQIIYDVDTQTLDYFHSNDLLHSKHLEDFEMQKEELNLLKLKQQNNGIENN